MGLRIAQVDAFASRPFSGNPAAVCILPAPAPQGERWMQQVAREMNLAETAFLHPENAGYRLRWFTPTVEVALCGHATLASAHVLWEEGCLPPGGQARFHTQSGLLTADRGLRLRVALLRAARRRAGGPRHRLRPLRADAVLERAPRPQRDDRVPGLAARRRDSRAARGPPRRARRAGGDRAARRAAVMKPLTFPCSGSAPQARARLRGADGAPRGDRGGLGRWGRAHTEPL